MRSVSDGDVTGRTTLIDCDVHCVPPSVDSLRPFLAENWLAFLDESGFRAPAGLGLTYPSWSQMLRTAGAESDLSVVVDTRLRDADLVLLHTYYGVESLTHPYLADALATAVNRWIETEWLARDQRLIATIVVNPQDTAGAVAEIQRCARNEQFVGVLLPVRSAEPYGSRRYWPIWEAAVAEKLPLTLTYGGSAGVPPSPVGWFDSLFEDYGAEGANFQAQVTSLIMSGITQLLPEIRIVVTESGWTWLPSLMARADREWKGLRREVPWIKDLPSEYMTTHVRMTTNPTDCPPGSPHLAEILGQFDSARMLMFGSDYPHHYQSPAADLLAILPPDHVEQVSWRNAADCFGLYGRLAPTDEKAA